ncbi:hypothetical protein KM043_002731 [Ampulex compressa]|nr:hypothetical protein KM043_002731 [Ampulex compressa]
MKMGCCQKLRNPVPKDADEGVETISSVPTDENIRANMRDAPYTNFRGAAAAIVTKRDEKGPAPTVGRLVTGRQVPETVDAAVTTVAP